MLSKLRATGCALLTVAIGNYQRHIRVHAAGRAATEQIEQHEQRRITTTTTTGVDKNVVE